jgi:hypothetical protein
MDKLAAFAISAFIVVFDGPHIRKHNDEVRFQASGRSLSVKNFRLKQLR